MSRIKNKREIKSQHHASLYAIVLLMQLTISNSSTAASVIQTAMTTTKTIATTTTTTTTTRTNATAVAAMAAVAMDCKQQNGHNIMWGDVDPNVFYICDPETSQPLQLRCPEGRGFFNGFGYYGCLPYTEWPACLPQETRPDEKVLLCDNEHTQQQPWETADPNKFYMCVNDAAEPVLVNWEIGKGFVSAPSGGNSNTDTLSGGSGSGGKILGCATWTKWRGYMQCEQYY